ncbi:oxidoreductase [Oscillospiraceae bacterium]|nr:oxidoreductase [Oscillospiraceae bacterium]BDF73163.1 oxidoreductase [Oscillospiraceae bacterium]
MDRILKGALAGYGLSGEVFHAPFLAADPRFSLDWVWERSTDRCRARYPEVKTVREYGALLESDADFIVLGVPNALHVPLAQQAMRAGKHVVVEKPVTATAAEAEGLFAVARETGRLLAVYQNRRWDGGYRTARRLVESGELREIVEWQGRYDRFTPVPRAGTWRAKEAWRERGEPGVGTLYDLGSHLVDQVVALFGAPEAVWADLAARRPGSEIDDDFVVHLFYPGMRATLAASQMAAQPGPHLTVRGTRGSYVKERLDVQEAALKGGAAPGGPDWGRDDPADYGRLTAPGTDGLLRSQAVETLPGDYGLFYDALYRTLAGGEEFPVREEQVITVLRILEAAGESSRTGRKITL